MAEFEDANPNFDPPEIEMLMGRQTTIDRAHALARAAEADLNRQLQDFEGDEEEKQQLIDTTIAQLRFLCGHYEMPIIVNGHAWENTMDPTTLNGMYDADDPSTHDTGYMHTEKKELFDLRDRVLFSLGYAAIYASAEDHDRVVIRHVAMSQPKQISNPNQPAAIAGQTTFEIPIDNNDTTVKMVGEILPPDEALLRTFVPELMNQTDEIIGSDKSLQKKLRRLGGIDLNEFPILQEEDWKELKDEYLAYLNEKLQTDLFAGLYKISGFSEMVIVAQGRAWRVSIDDPKQALRAPLLRFRYDTVKKEEKERGLKLAISGVGYVKGNDWNELVIPLSPDIKVKPDSVIEIDGLPESSLPALLQLLLGEVDTHDDGEDDEDV